MKKLLVVSTMIALWSGLTAQAVTIVESTVFPTSDIIAGQSQQTVSGTDTQIMRNEDSLHVGAGQSFTLSGAETLQAITIQMGVDRNKNIAATGTHEFALWIGSYDDTTVSNHVAGATNLLTSIDVAGMSFSSSNYYTLNLDAPLALPAGDYAFQLYWTTAEQASHRIWWAENSAGGYADGQLLAQGDLPATEGLPFEEESLNVDEDLVFALHSAPVGIQATLTTPAELAMTHTSGAGSTTGTVDAVYTSSTNLDVTITISNQSNSNAFTVVSATPQTLTNETTELAFEFDNTVANLTFGETATGLVTFAWAETGGGASGTNFMSISATVPFPPIYVWNGSSDGDWNADANWETETGVAISPVFDNTAVIKMAGTANLDQYIRTHRTIKSLEFTSSNTAATQIGLVAGNGTADRDLSFEADSGNSTLTIDALATGNKTLGTSGGAVTPGEVVLVSDLDVTHNGSGDLIFAAEIRGDGDLSIAGTGATILSGVKTFTIGGDGTNNVISGSGTVSFDGSFSFNMTSAGTTVGDSWTIVDVDTLTETFGLSFTVDTFTDAGSDTWILDIDGTSAYQFSENTGVLTVIPSGNYQGWIESFGLTGDDLLEKTDVEGDGLDNLMEYALGGNPTNDDAAAVSPKTYTAEDGLTNWFYHVSGQRDGDALLTFTVGATPNLVYTPADTNDVEFVGASAVTDNYKTVTNRTEATPNAKFIKLEVQQN